MSRVKRSFWKSIFSFSANVSCERLVWESTFIFCECLVWNARFGSLHCHFLRMSRVKRSLWKLTFSLFANVSCETLVLEVYMLTFRDVRVKRLFWKLTFSFFANVSCETLVLEIDILIFCECLVWNPRFGSLHCHFLRMSRVKRSFWKLIFSLFANVSCEKLVLEVDVFIFLRMSRVKRSFWKLIFSFFANVSCETLVLEVYIVTFCKCLMWVLEIDILTFCECLVWNARFGVYILTFWRLSWKSPCNNEIMPIVRGMLVPSFLGEF